ncbi:Glutamine--fructose-6-phosphate aminotransferase [isomerizing] [hydrothermal vent metagenome]|uniref:Glutamine--fructose-6-phosphate aminotransferase [isomerizing] n=1 Tax=hydrothermal vent metagenome TaxID=652676 RepID=A0A3B0VMG0_9ZZZZ
MCGIVAATANRDIVDIIVNGLKTLEYRGYDSAGIAINHNNRIEIRKQAGKLNNLIQQLESQPVTGNSGIGHTRWATHGEPTCSNAHPHDSAQNIAVVHNGIIENYLPLKNMLITQGYEFKSDTDTETLVHLIHYYQQKLDFSAACHKALRELDGAYAVAITNSAEPMKIIAARKGSPLIVGRGQDENFIASDVQALINETNQFHYLEDGDIVEITPNDCIIYNKNNEVVTRQLKTIELSAEALSKDGYAHYMLKEIHEQPTAVANTLEDRLYDGQVSQHFIDYQLEKLLQQVNQIHITACGTSYHAGLIAKYWLESIARIPTQVEIASEYRYRNPVVPVATLFLTISQSGETADSLAALRFAQEQPNYLTTLAICNVANSTLDRESDYCLMTRAGPEIGVASTKALTTQMSVLALLTLKFAEINNIDAEIRQNLVKQLRTLPGIINQALLLDDKIQQIAKKIVVRDNALFLGRGVHYPIALEGALKLKEISYIHAEGYPAGELKHGPLALVDDKMPVIAVCPNDALLEKLKSNIEEVRARGGELFVFVDHKGDHGLNEANTHLIELEASGEFTSPIVFNIPLQLLAYHVALLRETDVDQPRNLAKSVTVE